MGGRHHHLLDDDVTHSSSRSLRNRKLSRRLLHHSHQTKRLFTPEIKRYLKNWLVRRRKNPYPSRSEKKDLAVKTGLTYVQICNWFANWRRKLKNSSRGREVTWGNLIKGYNVNARGNVEQFSISSDDSIWEDQFNLESDDNSDKMDRSTGMDHSYFSGSGESKMSHQEVVRWKKYGSQEFNNNRGEGLLGRWLESAAKYRGQWTGKHWPRSDSLWSRSNYHRSETEHRSDIWSRSLPQKQDWPRSESQRTEWPKSEPFKQETWSRSEIVNHPEIYTQVETKPLFKYRHREELDAAEALTFLSNACA